MISLDLHGVLHCDAQKEVKAFLKRNKVNRPLEIITGNSYEMKLLAAEILKEFSLDYEYKDYHNLGSLIIWKMK